MKTYYGAQTTQAHDNFPFPVLPVAKELIYAIVEIKKAAVIANYKAKQLDKQCSTAVITACNEILDGTFDDQFVLSSVQGGAGTSINMNVNEVIAARAQEILDKKKKHVHPNDHVNMSQSTNDVNPSALRIACIRLTSQLVSSLDNLIKQFQYKAEHYKTVQKLGRTHLQDAVPTTIGEEFNSYIAILERNRQRIRDAEDYLYDLNLGGTAIGNTINASKKYIEHVYYELRRSTHLRLTKSDNLMSLTSSSTDFCHLSSVITLLALDISKIATDLRILSSGPRGGLGELSLQALQPGSSIMPGKVNPVAPESMNQIYYFISGKNLTIQQAAEGASLELAIMFPVIADALITSLKLLTAGIDMFAEKCISTLQVNEERCKQHLEHSMAYATLLVPTLGYDIVSDAVKQAVKKQQSLREVIVRNALLTEKQFDEIIKTTTL